MLKTFPIFAKELYESAGRKSTYFIRVFYAVAVAIAYTLIVKEYQPSWKPVAGQLGYGYEVFLSLINTQSVLIVLAVPPLMSMAITSEKENNTITDLLMLPQPTGAILFQKYAGRLVPVISLLLASTPLLGVCFSLGGVSPSLVFTGTLSCICTACCVGALALAVSCYRDTSARATLETYLLLIILGPTCLSPISLIAAISGPVGIPFALFIAFVFTWSCFSAAKRHFRARAFNISEEEDLYVYTGEHRHERPITQLQSGKFRNRHGLPGEQAITWLEASSAIFSQKDFYLNCALGAGVFFLINVTGLRFAPPLSFIPYLLFAFAALQLLGSQNAILRLKRDAILPTLLTLPLTGREFVQQFLSGRMIGTHRILLILACCLVPCALFLGIDVHKGAESVPRAIAASILLYAGLMSCFYLYLTSLSILGTRIGLACKKGTTALSVSLILLILVGIVIPLFFRPHENEMGPLAFFATTPIPSVFLSVLLSEFSWLEVQNEDARIHFRLIIAAILVHHTFWTGLLLFLRHAILRNADRLLQSTASTN